MKIKFSIFVILIACSFYCFSVFATENKSLETAKQEFLKALVVNNESGLALAFRTISFQTKGDKAKKVAFLNQEIKDVGIAFLGELNGRFWKTSLCFLTWLFAYRWQAIY